MHTPFKLLPVSGVLCLAALPSHADTWTGATSAAWNVDTNWLDGTQPTSGEAIVFDSNSTANLATLPSAAFAVSGITVVSPTGGITLSNSTAGSIAIGAGGIDMSAATQNLGFTFAANSLVSFSADQTFNVAASRTLTFSGNASNRTFALGSRAFTKTGAGTTTFGPGVSLASGTFDIQAGTLGLSCGNNFSTTSPATVSYKVGSGATLAFLLNSGTLPFASPVEVNGGAITIGGGAGLTDSGLITGTGGTITAARSSTGTVIDTFSGGFSGSGTFDLRCQSTSSANHYISLTGNNSGFTGTFNLSATTGTRTVRLNSAVSGSSSANWNVNTANILQVAAFSVQLGNLSVSQGSTASFLTGSTVTIPAGKAVVIDTVSPATAATTLTVAGTVNNSGTLTAGRAAVVNLNTGAAWTQSADLSLAGNGGYGATVTVNTGAAFTYTGANPILLNPGGSSNATLTVAGGTFTTGASFQTTTASSPTAGTNNGILILQGGGTLKLSADLADIIAAPTGTAVKNLVQLGTGGGIIDTNSHTATLGQAITGAGGFTKAGTGLLALTGTNTYTGDTIVTGGILSLGTATLADASKVKITTGATLALDHGTTDTVDQLFIDGTQQLSGTWGAPGSGAAHTSTVFSGTGLLNVTTAPLAYDAWVAARGLTTGVNAAKSDNPDNDGLNNLGEFALDGNPLSGVRAGKVALRNTVDGPTLTLPVRLNAGAFVGDSDGLLSPMIDGVRYRIQASTDLVSWNILVFETAPDTTGLPALSDPAGWEYRTFQIAPGNPKAFLRARITDTP